MIRVTKEIRMNEKQSEALDAMLRGENVFLTGEGGTGKSVVIDEFIRRTDRCVVQCAPTGIAAIHIGGITAHKLLKPPYGPIAPYTKPAKDNALMLTVETIIVDEVSMMRFDLFIFLISTIRYYESLRSCRIQLIVVGDMYQLPPVISNRTDGPALRKMWGDFGKGFPFSTKEWDQCKFHTYVLTEQMRQAERDFITNLGKLRVGDSSCIGYFNDRTLKSPNDGVTLCPNRVCARKINERRLAELPGKEKVYGCLVNGEFDIGIRPAADRITLKAGARVMTLRNDRDGRYQNGSFGTATHLYEDSVTIKFDNGNTANVGYCEWQSYDYEVGDLGQLVKKQVGSFSQIPVQLAYAITIHKSQGQTYEKINVQPNCFAEGQLYVAISRVRSIGGLFIDGEIRGSYVKASDEVAEFYSSLTS